MCYLDVQFACLDYVVVSVSGVVVVVVVVVVVLFIWPGPRGFGRG